MLFPEQFFKMHFGLGEFLNLFCVFPLVFVCVRTRSEEFRFVLSCEHEDLEPLSCGQNFSGRTCPRAVVEVRLGSEV